MNRYSALGVGLVLLARLGMADTYYVSLNGEDAWPGTSWALAKRTLRAGVEAARDGDTVWVAEGTYRPAQSVTLDKGVTVKSVKGPRVTRVDGSSPAIRCFSVSHAAAVLDGFTITGGYDTDYGGGVWNNGTVQHCILTGNTGYRGGGAYNSGLMQKCLVYGNTSSFRGGGIWNDGLVLTCVIADNTALYGGGVWNNSLILNATVAKNQSTLGPVGGLFNYFGVVRNCIIQANGNGDYGEQAGSYAPQYSCAPGLFGEGNLAANPSFADPDRGDFRLQASSPCVNAGINQEWMMGASDLDGDPRILDGRVDMGAYECRDPRTIIGPVIKANGLTHNAFVRRPGLLSVSVQLDPGPYAGTPVDWWIVAQAGPAWYYLDGARQWVRDDDPRRWRPVYQGALFRLAPAEALRTAGLPPGLYTCWFAVDFPLDGTVNLDGRLVAARVDVAVQ